MKGLTHLDSNSFDLHVRSLFNTGDPFLEIGYAQECILQGIRIPLYRPDGFLQPDTHTKRHDAEVTIVELILAVIDVAFQAIEIFVERLAIADFPLLSDLRLAII